MDWRTFLEMTAAASGVSALAALGAAPATAAAAEGGLRKAVYVSMLPKELGYVDKFKLAVEVGFQGIEIGTIGDPAAAAEIKEASARTGLVIHGVMNADHWRYLLSSADPEVVNRSVAGVETSLRNAKLWGAGVVLLVPGVVSADSGYRDVWTRSQKVIRERILPLATELSVVIGIEEVWNKFLLSPLEAARYVDEFASPWVKAYLDVGNMLFYGFPQDWVRMLGPRICRVHVKDFKLTARRGSSPGRTWAKGTWTGPPSGRHSPRSRTEGWVTTEIGGGDAAYLKDVVARLDRFFAGQRPVAPLA